MADDHEMSEKEDSEQTVKKYKSLLSKLHLFSKVAKHKIIMQFQEWRLVNDCTINKSIKTRLQPFSSAIWPVSNNRLRCAL